jgi:hypothetical protein
MTEKKKAVTGGGTASRKLFREPSKAKQAREEENRRLRTEAFGRPVNRGAMCNSENMQRLIADQTQAQKEIDARKQGEGEASRKCPNCGLEATQMEPGLSYCPDCEQDLPKASAARELTPYQTIKATGEKSSFHSPDGFVKIEEFENGARYLHSPLIEYPVRMSNWK